MTLTHDDRVILRYMREHGAYRPGSKTRFNAIQRLLAAGCVEEHDPLPGSYTITPLGESELEADEVMA